MTQFFTHYWEAATVNDNPAGAPIRHLAGKQFRRKGVGPGDHVYPVSIRGGKMYVLGRVTVEPITDEAEARKRLGLDDLYPGSDHVIARQSAECAQTFVQVGDEKARQLLFHSEGGLIPLTFRKPGRLDGQTLRGVRRLSAESARLLDAALALTP